ncbi:MAG TPA: DUF5590 domain-containing protein [Metalysinibacillus sp.]
MKKWLITVVSVVIIAGLAIGITLLVSAQSSYRNVEKKATDLALTEKVITSANDAYVYNGSLAYITVIGTDKNNDKKAIFVPANFSKKAIQQVWLDDGLSKRDALTKLQEQAEVESVLHTKLGYEEPGAVWEITYIDSEDQLNYMYYQHENGEQWKHITVTEENDDL